MKRSQEATGALTDSGRVKSVRDSNAKAQFQQAGAAPDSMQVDSSPEYNPVGLIVHETRDQTAARLLNTPAAAAWKSLGVHDRHGVCVPVFALKTDASCGVGEFMDLIPFVDWCSQHDLGIVQLLPINASHGDNSPFAPMSSFSLHPLLLSPRALPNFHDVCAASSRAQEIVNQLAASNKAERINWDSVRELKNELFGIYFQNQKQGLTALPEYQQYMQRNAMWLRGFGLYCVLKETHGGQPWWEWPDVDITQVDEKGISQRFNELSQQHAERMQYHMTLQFLCHKQMEAASAHAGQKKVLFKGDIPFLVSRDSADVWLNQMMFKLDFCAGAPADGATPDGQNWGLPLYNWDAHRSSDFAWWKQRLDVAKQYFSLFRVDHIVGFYRVWAVPTDQPGKNGSWQPEDANAWVGQGEDILAKMLTWSTMLPIGEDLGQVPNEVRQSLQRLGICGTKIPRWEREYEKDDKPAIPMSDYNADSMTSMSTHDSETLNEWWANHPDEAEPMAQSKGWQVSPGHPLSLEQRKELLREAHHSASLFHIDLLGEYLATVPFLDYNDLALDRINLPGTVEATNWSFRMKPTIAVMAENADLSNSIKQIVS